MLGNNFMSLYSKQQLASLVGVEDWVDRLNHGYTVVVLALCSAVVTSETYFSKSIACHMPTTPSGTKFQNYVENYCWVEGTMPLYDNETTPQTPEEWQNLAETRKINYYQWVPFMLALQCILFLLPRVAWQCVSYNRLGTDLTALVVKANDALHATSQEARNKCIKHVARSLELLLFAHRDNRVGLLADMKRQLANMCGFCFVSKRMGTWTVFSYFCIKLLYLMNCCLQLNIMRIFLGYDTSLWAFGLNLAKHLQDKVTWRETLYFPRVSYCFLSLRHLGARANVYAGTCALPINMLNEKIYIFLFFWISIVTIVTAFSIPAWLYRLGTRRRRTHMIYHYFRLKQPRQIDAKIWTPAQQACPSEITLPTASYLTTPSIANCMNLSDVEDFVTEFLRLDGVFLVYVLRLNAGDVITGEIVRLLWYSWCQSYAGRRNFNHDVWADDADPEESEVMRKPTYAEALQEDARLAAISDASSLRRRPGQQPTSKESHYV